MSESNPLGITGIDHLEFTADSTNSPTRELFYRYGFNKTFESENGDEELFSQGQVRFLFTTRKEGQSRDYLNNHGEGVSKISFSVNNTEHAMETAAKRGAKVLSDMKSVEDQYGVYRTGLIQGFGDVVNEFVERPNAHFRSHMKSVASDSEARPLKQRVSRIDHLTNNVPHGEMDHWVDFYGRIFGFKQTRFFDIKGVKTGLQSKVVQLEDNSVIIPINEPEVADGKSQIQEFLDLHKGAGVQHIALMTADVMETVAELRERDIKFLDVPDTYYEDLPNRPFKVTEDISKLNQLRLLADGDPEGYLLQIFTETQIGPLFYEFIQRKNHWGFGEGNFQALFDAIERDQIKRGYLEE